MNTIPQASCRETRIIRAAEIAAAQVLLNAENRLFWIKVREGLIVIIRAIERRYLPDVKKSLQ